jgi:hypothetical protein
MYKAFVTIIFLLAVMARGHSQSLSSNRFKITYDPTLWRKELKLNREQCERISSINASFYQAVLIAGKERNSMAKYELEQLMTRRSEELWNLFSARQRRKWQKLQLSTNQRV